MMQSLLYSSIIFILLFLLIIYTPYNETIKNPDILNDPYVKIYRGFDHKFLIYEFNPVNTRPENNYIKQIIYDDVRSIDINMPKKKDHLDKIRKVEIYDIFNDHKELLLSVNSDSRIKLNFPKPLKKILIQGRL